MKSCYSKHIAGHLLALTEQNSCSSVVVP